MKMLHSSVNLCAKIMYKRRKMSFEKLAEIKLYKAHYQHQIDELDDIYEVRYYYSLLNDFKSLLKIRKFDRYKILEIGCGSGMLSILMAKEGANVWLIDKDEKWLEYSRLIVNSIKENILGNIYYIKADILNNDTFLSDYNSYFDIVHSEGLIEHYPYDVAVEILKNMKKLSVPRGKVIVGVPNFFSPDCIYLFTKYGMIGELYYSRKMLKKIMMKAGFFDVQMVSSSYIFPSIIYKHQENPLFKLSEKILKRFELGFLHLGLGTNGGDN